MTRHSDLVYGRQGGRVVPAGSAQGALDAISKAREAAGARWPGESARGMSEDEWRSAAAFARISQALGRPLTAKEQEAIRRYPDEPAAGTNMRGDNEPPDPVGAPLPQPDPPPPPPARAALHLVP